MLHHSVCTQYINVSRFNSAEFVWVIVLSDALLRVSVI